MNNGLVWKREVLSNGLVVLQYPRPSALTAQISVAIKYGSTDDENEKMGTAHFLEHMLVGGSLERIKLHHEIERWGGISNFETTEESTFSTIDIFPEKITDASKILSQLLFDNMLSTDKLELERKVILNEIAETSDNPQEKIADTLLKCLFRKHPVRNPICGSKKTVNQISLAELKVTHQNQYAPNNMICILTGKFSEKDAEAALANFQDKEKQNHTFKIQRKSEKMKPRMKATLERSGINQAYLCFGLRAPPAQDPDAITLDLINAVLGMGESSRLFVELREKRALTYDFSSMNIYGKDYGYFSVACAVKEKFIKQTQDIIKKELEKIKNDPIANGELEKSKNLILSDLLRSMDNSQELPRTIAEAEVLFSNEKALISYTNKIKSLTKEDIMTTANKYFEEDNYSIATLTPK